MIWILEIHGGSIDVISRKEIGTRTMIIKINLVDNRTIKKVIVAVFICLNYCIKIHYNYLS